jgi:hypothetical protein
MGAQAWLLKCLDSHQASSEAHVVCKEVIVSLLF